MNIKFVALLVDKLAEVTEKQTRKVVKRQSAWKVASVQMASMKTVKI